MSEPSFFSMYFSFKIKLFRILYYTCVRRTNPLFQKRIPLFQKRKKHKKNKAWKRLFHINIGIIIWRWCSFSFFFNDTRRPIYIDIDNFWIPLRSGSILIVSRVAKTEGNVASLNTTSLPDFLKLPLDELRDITLGVY